MFPLDGFDKRTPLFKLAQRGGMEPDVFARRGMQFFQTVESLALSHDHLAGLGMEQRCQMEQPDIDL